MNRSQQTPRRPCLTDQIRAAIDNELESNREDLERHEKEIGEVRVTVKVRSRKVKRVIFSRHSERDLED